MHANCNKYFYGIKDSLIEQTPKTPSKRANKTDTQTSSKNKGIIHFPPIVIISTNVQLNGIAMLAYDIILQSAYRNREEATILNSDCRTTRKTIPHYVSRDTRKRALTM